MSKESSCPGECIKVENVTFSYGNGTPVLKNISFSVHHGDFIGILGPNGSGKTTLIKLILGLEKYYDGEIFLLGQNIKEFNKWDAIGYVPQKATNFDPHFPATVREIVGMGLLSQKSFPKMMSPNDDKLILKALEDVDMADFIDRRIGDLSGGQQQRVFIARALISNPDTLFLDEPTTGIDQQTQEKFYDLLGKLNKEKDITILMISHDIGSITAYVNKLAFINQKLAFYGTHEHFCRSDIAVDLITHKKHLICDLGDQHD